MRMEITRDQLLPEETLGELKVFDDTNAEVFTCRTLELPWKENQRKISCIPPGEYMVVKRQAHELRKYNHFHVKDVPGRDYILIHTGNYNKHTHGCILVGEGYKDINADGLPDLKNSTVTLKMLYAIMPQKFKLTIK